MLSSIKYWHLSLAFSIPSLLYFFIPLDLPPKFVFLPIAIIPGFLLAALFFGIKAFREKGTGKLGAVGAITAVVLLVILVLYFLFIVWIFSSIVPR